MSCSDACTSTAVSWLCANSALLIAPSMCTAMTHVPFSLHPTPLPRALYEHGYALAVPYNKLYDAVARDSAWLLATLDSVSGADAFTSRLLAMYRRVLTEGVSQPLTLGVHRSDYMQHVTAEGRQLQQVEFNTVSVALAALSSRVSGLHRFMYERSRPRPSASLVESRLPTNPAGKAVPDALAAAHKLYGREECVILFVVQVVERNIMDQRMLELHLWEAHKIPVVRLTMAEVSRVCRVDADGRLMVSPCAAVWEGTSVAEVSVVYFRAGYTPKDFPTDVEWDVRWMIESSKAVKCPNVAYHLAGTKKVQQALALPGVLERYLSPSESVLVRSSFAGLWGLGPADEGRDAAIAAAIARPENYVLKPQREGGGNNIYNENVRTALITMTPEELSAYILMERIFPPAQTSTLVRSCEVCTTATVSEFGVFSVYLRSGDEVVLNEAAGHLLRTKTADSDEGGVAAGYSVLDSPLLED